MTGIMTLAGMVTLNGKMTMTGMMTMTGVVTMTGKVTLTGMIHIILANIVPCASMFGNGSGVNRGQNGLNAVRPVDGDGKKDFVDVVYDPACFARIGIIESFHNGNIAINTNVVSL